MRRDGPWNHRYAGLRLAAVRGPFHWRGPWRAHVRLPPLRCQRWRPASARPCARAVAGPSSRTGTGSHASGDRARSDRPVGHLPRRWACRFDRRRRPADRCGRRPAGVPGHRHPPRQPAPGQSHLDPVPPGAPRCDRCAARASPGDDADARPARRRRRLRRRRGLRGDASARSRSSDVAQRDGRALAVLPDALPAGEGRRTRACPDALPRRRGRHRDLDAPTEQAAQDAPHAELRRYPGSHFSAYQGGVFEQMVSDEVEFLRTQFANRPASTASR